MGTEDRSNSQESTSGPANQNGETDKNGSETVAVKLPSGLVNRARELGLDVTRYCTRSLRKGVAVLESVNSPEDSGFERLGPNVDEVSSRESDELAQLKRKKKDKIIEDFQSMLEIDKNLAERTVNQHKRNIKQFLKFVDVSPEYIGKSDIRNWLRKWKENYARSTYANKVKSLRVFFRDYLKSDLAESLSMPQPQPSSDGPPTKDQIRNLYEALDTLRDKTILLMFATTGLRRNELMGLSEKNIDFAKRMVTPNKNSRTKRTYVTFYNNEAEDHLEKYLSEKDIEEEIFPIRPRSVNRIFRKRSKEAGLETVTPQDLRNWFTEELRKKKISGEYIDAFCGRLPRSVRGKHYTDYSPERLKEVYEEADLKVLE
ncbi:hypothetical protein AKJ52_00505 [candidate division MSBL1 archaeon SCGC-AAA382C18]|uniref:Tyr recombinase domain-containing protein n=1 Tax=candidate division MSBL1 archaeon SCGC-AAA382C18 TaxID=1698281 RepID=A0A133VLM4_9EURY|nr:hypothetical protein AKJ52_00505 [candidate division MSBL1 archaeon SCGC-AAA382C18]